MPAACAKPVKTPHLAKRVLAGICGYLRVFRASNVKTPPADLGVREGADRPINLERRNMPTKIARPKLPYHRSPEYGFAPKSLDHVKPGGWIECVVGDGYQYIDGEPRNRIFAVVLGFSAKGTTFAVVSSEVQYPSLTGVEDGDVLELELADITNPEFSPAQQQLELFCEMQEVESQIYNAHRDEFNRLHPDFSDETVAEIMPSLRGQEYFDWIDRRGQLRKEFVARPIAEGRA